MKRNQLKWRKSKDLGFQVFIWSYDLFVESLIANSEMPGRRNNVDFSNNNLGEDVTVSSFMYVAKAAHKIARAIRLDMILKNSL